MADFRRPVVLAAIVLAAWGVILWAPLTYDDYGYVATNPFLLGPWPGVAAFLGRSFGGAGDYEPLNAMIHWGLLHAWGAWAPPYRLTSLLLHGANVLLLLGLARRWLASDRAAFWAAALFALFPAHAEVLAVSTFKKHLLVAFFALGLLRARESALPFRIRAALCWSLQAAALLCRESALLLPFLALLAAWKERSRRDRALLGGLFGLAAAYLALRLFVVPRTLLPALGAGLGGRLLTSGKCLLWLLGHLAAPWELCLEHTLRPVGGRADACAVVLGLGACAAGSVWLGRLDRRLGFAVAWIWLCLLPYLGLVPFANLSPVTDRYLYLPALGACLALARATELWLPRRRAAYAVLGLVAAYAARGIGYAALFADPLELWTRAAACAPANPRAQAALGSEFLRRGRYPEAEASFRRALEIEPAYLTARLDLAAVYAETDRLDEAARLAAEIAARVPDPRAWHQLGVYRLRAGRPAEALAALERAAQLAPEDGEIRLNLGLSLLKLGRRARAREELELAAQDPRVRARATGTLGRMRRARARIADSSP